MTTTTATVPTGAATDTTWLRLVQVSLAVVAPALVVLSSVMMFFTTVDGGEFRYAADYWLTAPGLPITLGFIGMVLGVHRLQHGADGRLGTAGTWLATLALAELFVQLLASVVTGTEVRWGPSYPVATLLLFVGVALLAAGSWRTGLLPRWVLGVWPLVLVLGSLASFGPTPLVLVAFLIGFGATLTRRVHRRVG